MSFTQHSTTFEYLSKAFFFTVPFKHCIRGLGDDVLYKLTFYIRPTYGRSSLLVGFFATSMHTDFYACRTEDRPTTASVQYIICSANVVECIYQLDVHYQLMVLRVHI